MTILVDHHEPPEIDLMLAPIEVKIGRASCRERV